MAVFQFTLTCSHRPIFICFVSVATFLVALGALICGLLFSKCSAKNLWLSSLNWALNRQYGLVAKPPVNPHQIQSIRARLSVLIRRSARNFRVARHRLRTATIPASGFQRRFTEAIA